MSAPDTARAEVLARIRSALGDGAPAAPVPRDYRTTGAFAPGSPELVTQLTERLQDYRATVIRVDSEAMVGHAVADALTSRTVDHAIAPPGLPPAWTARLPHVTTDDGSATARDLDQIPAVITGSVLAVADTGTIALDGSPLCGRRAITLVPDTHLCIVLAGDIVHTVPEGLAGLDPARPLTLISGPSATSDIELSRVEGVHGPRTLIVLIVG
ncbi:LUD domain-containing protein [Nostocoides sp. HKS02]|uniref:LutC/YkgG family protein n=1 Tax=Nostocoides sp. HKS02 TaxID=1813880 RepID=UPI001E635879|nr:LUD domain-containing protein [Tetrasphaera sp. HKS02]